MKKKAISVTIIFFSILSIILVLNVTAFPGYDQDHDLCHTVPGGYTIGHTLNASNNFEPSTNLIFNVTATGSNLFIQAPSDSKDNALFNFLPSMNRITDGSAQDLNPNANQITVTFNITTPAQEQYYYILILAGDDSVSGSPPPFAYVEIGFSIGGAVIPSGFDFSIIFDHLGLYLGMPALILVSLSTILVLVNESKFVKLHGILAGSSWILTCVNVSAAIIKISPQAWLGGWDIFYHVPHIILGAIGLITGFLSMLFGIAAERRPAKITGYITLICWWAAFFTGYLLNQNLLLL